MDACRLVTSCIPVADSTPSATHGVGGKSPVSVADAMNGGGSVASWSPFTVQCVLLNELFLLIY